GRRGSGGARRSDTSRGHCQAASRSRPCQPGRGRCSGPVSAGAAERCATGTTRWDFRGATRWGRRLPPPHTSSRCRVPVAAAFGMEMPPRSFSLLLVVSKHHPIANSSERIQRACAVARLAVGRFGPDAAVDVPEGGALCRGSPRCASFTVVEFASLINEEDGFVRRDAL